MNTLFRDSFVQDLRDIRDSGLLRRIEGVIAAIEQAAAPSEIANLQKLKGWMRYYRIRVGDYRLGLSIEGNTATLVRFLHRKDMYRYFP